MSERVYLPLSEFEPDREHILAATGLAPEVLAVLGEETVLDLESKSVAIEWLENLANSPNPFSTDWSCEVDLSFLNNHHANFLRGINRSPRLRSKNEKPLSAAEQRRLYLRRRNYLQASCDDTEDRFGTSLNEALPQLLEAQETVDQTLFSHIGSDDELNLEQFAGYAEFLHEVAQVTPTAKTTETLIGIRRFLLREYRRGVIHSKAFGIRWGMPVRLNSPGRKDDSLSTSLERAQQMHETASVVRKRGKDEYQKITPIAHKEALLRALHLSRDIVEVKEFLTAQEREASADEFAAILEAERYLVDKAQWAHDVLKVDPEKVNHPEVRQTIRLATDPVVRNTSEARKREADLALVKTIQPEISDARDILAGGGRLDPSNPTVREVADELWQLTPSVHSKERIFEDRVESGLIVAILFDRFHNFKNLFERIRQGEEAVAAAIRFAPTTFATLQRYDLDNLMEGLAQRIYHPGLKPAIDHVVGIEGMDKLMGAVHEYQVERRQSVEAEEAVA